jgi:hypothetical protein
MPGPVGGASSLNPDLIGVVDLQHDWITMSPLTEPVSPLGLPGEKQIMGEPHLQERLIWVAQRRTGAASRLHRSVLAKRPIKKSHNLNYTRLF